MTAIKSVDWVFIDIEKGDVYCDRCGRRHPFNSMLPLPADVVPDLLKVYQKAHRYCREKRSDQVPD